MKEIQILNNGDALYDIRRKINENFELVHEKATKEPLVSFGVNEGNETDGVADLLNIDGDTLNFKVGGEYPNLVMTSGDGVTTKIESVNPLHLQNLADGEYKVVVDGSNSNITDAEFYSQLLEPENPNDGDVWFNGENAVSLINTNPKLEQLPSQQFGLRCMANIGDTYVSAGAGNKGIISYDKGQSWQTITLDTSSVQKSFVGCEVYNNKFYLVAQDRAVRCVDLTGQVTSANTISNTGDVVKFKKVNDIYFVTTSQGIYYSNNMDTWTFKSIQSAANIQDICYTNGLYFCIILAGNVFYSSDLNTWVSCDTSFTNSICLEVLNQNTLLVGTTNKKFYSFNVNTMESTAGNLPADGTINDIAILKDGGILMVGSGATCYYTTDLENFESLTNVGATFNYVYDNYVLANNGIMFELVYSSQWVPYPYIPVGELSISGGQVTYFTTYPYNTNGLFEATSSTFGLLRTAAEPDELNCHCQEAVLTPANLYNLNNYRTMNTSYEVDQKVGCPYHHNLQLKCTQAGTTSEEALNTKGYLEPGTTIEDGSVVWEVEELGTGGGAGLQMFDTILKDHVLTYEESKGLALQGTYVYKDAIAGSRYGYPDFYAKCLEEYNEATATETVNGVTVKVHSNGHKFYDIANKSAIDGFFNTMGSAWFYGVDTAEERIFLPRNNYLTSYIANGDKSVSVYGNGKVLGFWDGSSSYYGLLGLYGSAYGGFDKRAYNVQLPNGSFTSNIQKPASGTALGLTPNASASGITGNVNIQNSQNGMYLYICVGNTVADTSWVDVVTQVESGVKDLEDKTNEGLEALANASNALRTTQITNCLLEIPQRIKLELNNGILTLKAGSEVIVPNGFEADGTTPKFDYVTVESDVVNNISTTTAQKAFLFYNSRTGKFNYWYAPNIYSGSGAPSSSQAGTLWYDATNNQFYWKTDSTWLMLEDYSLPLGIGTWDGSKWTSIDQVFNGLGYIGSTAWIDKGVKGLIPNGRNTDGTLKNVEFTTPNLKVRTWAYESINQPLFYDVVADGIQSSGSYYVSEMEPISPATYWVMWYNPRENIMRYSGDNGHWTVYTNWLFLGVYTSTSNSADNYKLTQFTLPKTAFRAVDYSDYVNTPHIVETYKNNTSWYRIWSDGWCEQGGNPTASNGRATVTFLKPFADTSYSILITGEGNAGSDHVSFGVGKISASSASLSWDGNDADPLRIFWEAKGKIF